MTTIKEHLAAIREEVGDNFNLRIREKCSVLKRIAAIEVELDRPMKSDEEWDREHWESDNPLIDTIRAIQQDACRSVLSDKQPCISKTDKSDIQQAESVDAQERGVFKLTDQDIRLACGELNSDEMRLARAIIKWLEFRFNNRL